MHWADHGRLFQVLPISAHPGAIGSLAVGYSTPPTTVGSRGAHSAPLPVGTVPCAWNKGARVRWADLP